jgi:hypothetical protein
VKQYEIDVEMVTQVLSAHQSKFQTYQEIAEYVSKKYKVNFNAAHVATAIRNIRENSLVYGYTVPKVKPGRSAGKRFYRVVAEDSVTTPEEMDLLDVGYISSMRGALTACRLGRKQSELAVKTATTKTDRRAAKRQVAFFAAQEIYLADFLDDYAEEPEEDLVLV